MDAFSLINSSLDLFEKHENVYKPKGRLFSSPESIYRPLLHRYDLRIKNNYRVPPEVKFLIILPELDVKGYQSPSIKSWLEEIETNTIIPRQFLHVGFISDFFGILPIDLNSTFPMGQFESINQLSTNDIIYQKFAQRIENFFKFHGEQYDKCGILTPDQYINQFNEETEYSKKQVIASIFDNLKSKFTLIISMFEDIPGILQFFKDD